MAKLTLFNRVKSTSQLWDGDVSEITQLDFDKDIRKVLQMLIKYMKNREQALK